MGTEWEEANKWEEAWWGDCSNTADEEAKQVFYADQMRIPRWQANLVGAVFDVGGKSILDIGGGPVSILLKCRNRGRSVVVDPANYPAWIIERYKVSGIEYIKQKAEKIDLEPFDEVWIYNVLQHVEDPVKVLETARRLGKVIRIFEWIETEVNIGHPHCLTQDFLEMQLGVVGKVIKSPWGSATAEKAWIGVKEVVNNKYRFHLLGLAHTQTTKEYIMCAYTQKVLKMAFMIKDLGHEVIHYGAEGSEVPCEHVTVISKEEQHIAYGDYDLKKEFFKHDPHDTAYKTFEEKAIKEINKRKKDRDFLLIPFGNYQRPIADAVNVSFPVEMGIGYTGVFSKYRVFESYAWMHYIYGILGQGDGSWYDAVIPNYFDPDDFIYSETKSNYFLYMGRLIARKGLEVALQVCKEIGAKLIVAGQGNPDEFKIKDYPNVEYIGTADVKQRAELMAGARALFVPTYYFEPFGGVSIEAAFCGTPVITTDWGCFAENVLDHITGYRCRTFGEFVWAAQHVDRISPKSCQLWAFNNFTMGRIKNMYQAYFDQLYDLRNKGWYDGRDTGISKYNRVQRYYPE